VELDVHPVVLRPADGEGEAITDKPDRKLRLLSAHEWLTYGWYRYGEGQRGAEPHVHREHSDGFYVLDGQITVRLGPELEPLVATTGTLVLIPSGLVHAFDNDSSGEARFINFHAPDGGFARYLRTREEEGFDSFDPPDEGGRPASDAIVTPPGCGERFEREDRTLTILGELPQISVVRIAVTPAWQGIPTHDHDSHVDSFFVLEGEADMVVGDKLVTAGAGSFYGAVPGAKHGIPHDPGGHAVFLNVHGPDAGFAESIRRG
jgi:quercetin dioxygenase-like cupin family protein